MDKFWKTYRTISLYLIFPAICMFVIGMFSNLLDQDPERFDRQTQGVVSCVDKTDRSRASRENGGFMLVFQIKAEYQVDGVTYTCKETGGSPRKVGSEVTITYNSAKPSDSTLNTDPVAGKSGLGIWWWVPGSPWFSAWFLWLRRKYENQKRKRKPYSI